MFYHDGGCHSSSSCPSLLAPVIFYIPHHASHHIYRNSPTQYPIQVKSSHISSACTLVIYLACQLRRPSAAGYRSRHASRQTLPSSVLSSPHHSIQHIVTELGVDFPSSLYVSAESIFFNLPVPIICGSLPLLLIPVGCTGPACLATTNHTECSADNLRLSLYYLPILQSSFYFIFVSYSCSFCHLCFGPAFIALVSL